MILKTIQKKFAGVFAAAGFFAVVGCGNSSNPDAIKIDDLKAAGGLKITDMGSGSVKLTWYIFITLMISPLLGSLT
jgi:hypothetical protein